MKTKEKSLYEFVDKIPNNTIQAQIIRSDRILKNHLKLAEQQNKFVTCSISGGSDSDILLDFIWRLDTDNKIKYLF